MIAALKTAALSLAVVIGGSLEYDPQQLVIEWQDGAVARIAATSPDTCAAAVGAIEGGLWVPKDPGREVARVHCEPGNLFTPGSELIPGYNAPRSGR